MAVPPIATKIFLFASMSREFRCQCPLVTPAALTGNGCADASAGTSMEITQTARSSFFTAILRAISSPKSQIPKPKTQIQKLGFGIWSLGFGISCHVDSSRARTTTQAEGRNEVSVPDFRRRKDACDHAEESA